MTDFFTRLAERTLGLTPRVQPLLASRYAPGPATPGFPDKPNQELALLAQGPLADPTQAVTPLSRGSSLSAPEQVPGGEASETLATSRLTKTVAEASFAVDKTTPPAALETVVHRGKFETHAASQSTNGIAKASLAADETTGLTTSSAEDDAAPADELGRGRRSQQVRVQSSAHSVLTPAAPNGVKQPTDSVRNNEQSHAAPFFLSPVPQAHLEPTAESGVIVRPLVARAGRPAESVRPQPAATASHAAPLPPARESGPPVIRVTIGRIEVRAIMPPTPAAERPAPGRASPVLSLDEYLKRRNGEQR